MFPAQSKLRTTSFIVAVFLISSPLRTTEMRKTRKNRRSLHRVSEETYVAQTHG
ncbi:hypothetical protein BDV33DRAFT_178105 [Aspergillus novoparasiticus]|uniref:Uncharacterized protein n=1 Tax=Aspergillus novoparasiticus TaxID=986946 RepID=A0A5N6EHM1_9EURO|nr:hypothetical protein BDV33DRAFT_178105 [Aspergillus novoparasiticus]